jgi:hypothetical protein
MERQGACGTGQRTRAAPRVHTGYKALAAPRCTRPGVLAAPMPRACLAAGVAQATAVAPAAAPTAGGRGRFEGSDWEETELIYRVPTSSFLFMLLKHDFRPLD